MTSLTGMRYFIFLFLVLNPVSGTAQSLERIGELRYRRLIDPVTDADRSLVYTAEVNAREVRTGRTTDWIGRIIWRCDGHQVEVILRADNLPVDSANIRWRVDAHTASDPETWKTGASGVSVFAPPRAAHHLTSLAKSGARVVVRVIYAVGGDFDYEFGLGGAEAAIGRLACDPAGSTEDAQTGPGHTGEGTTHAVWGWYNRNQRIEERWALHRKNSYLPERRFSS